MPIAIIDNEDGTFDLLIIASDGSHYKVRVERVLDKS